MKYISYLRDAITGREHVIAYMITALTVGLCWAAILMAGDQVKSSDELGFLAIAKNLAFEGRFANEDGVLTAYPAPGIVFFITPFVKIGAGLMELRLANAVLVGCSMLLLFSLVRRNAGPLSGLLAIALAPLWPVVLYAATTIYPQTLATFLLVLTVWLLDQLSRSRSLGISVLAGLACGFLILTIPIILLVFPIFAIWIVLRSPRRWLHALVFCAVSAGFVGSWTARNYAAFDAFVPVATSSGYNLLAGNTPGARYNSSLDVPFPDHVYTEITGKTEVERNDIFTRVALEEIRKDPGRIARLYLGKFLHWFDYSNTLLSDTVLEGGASGLNVSTREIVLFVTYCLMILPLLTHIALMRRYPFKPIEVLGLCLWVGTGLAYAIFFTRVRFRLPFDWMIFASNGIFLAAVIEHHIARWKASIRP